MLSGRRVLERSIHRIPATLQENRKKWRRWISSGMVSVGFCNVSATLAVMSDDDELTATSIGDWYPERNLFQILIALTSGTPRTITRLPFYPYGASRASFWTRSRPVSVAPIISVDTTSSRVHLWLGSDVVVWGMGVYHIQ